MAQPGVEPSMEEILSSIKRIIAEDATAAMSAPKPKRSVGLTPMSKPATVPSELDENNAMDEPDVLELTDPVAVEPEVGRATPAVHATDEVEEAAMPAAEKVTAAPKKPALVSPITEEASRSSLAALSSLIVKPEVTGSDTLEGLVREMLRPMLAEWLDANLPAIVERQVAQEIARITARG